MRKEVDAVCDVLVVMWAVSWVSVAVLVWGMPQWWSVDSAAGGLTRLVFLWVGIVFCLSFWGFRHKLLKIRDIPLLILLPLLAPSAATILKLSVPVSEDV